MKKKEEVQRKKDEIAKKKEENLKKKEENARKKEEEKMKKVDKKKEEKLRRKSQSGNESELLSTSAPASPTKIERNTGLLGYKPNQTVDKGLNSTLNQSDKGLNSTMNQSDFSASLNMSTASGHDTNFSFDTSAINRTLNYSVANGDSDSASSTPTTPKKNSQHLTKTEMLMARRRHVLQNTSNVEDKGSDKGKSRIVTTV